MRTAILSDIHGNDVAFEAVEKDMRTLGVQTVVFLGDLVAVGPDPAACFRRMKALNPLVWLKGNTEYWLDYAMTDQRPGDETTEMVLAYYDYLVHHMESRAMDELIRLKDMAKLKLGHFDCFCCHGSPLDPSEAMLPRTGDASLINAIADIKEMLVFHGHTHKSDDVSFHGHRFINPGAVGFAPEGKPGIAEYMLVDDAQGLRIEAREVSYDLEWLIANGKNREMANFDDWSKRVAGNS